jgi:hypothetical protein
MVSGKMFGILFAMLRLRARLVLLAALLAAACGTSPTAAPPASGPASGTVDTPQGRVEISLQGGTFAQGPEAVQGFTPPQGLQAPYGAVRFTARVGQPGGALTLRVRLPQPLMLGSSLLKQVGTSHLPIPIEASGNEVVYRIADGGPFDADGTRNGTITDPWWVATGRFAVAITSDPSDWAWRADITHQCVLRGVSDPQTISVTVRRGSASSLLFSFHPVTRTGDPLPAGIRFSPNPFTLSLDGRDPQFTEEIPVEISGSTPPGTYKALVEVSEPGQPPVLAPVNLTVEALPPNIQMQLDQSAITVQRGSSATLQLTVTVTPPERSIELQLGLLTDSGDGGDGDGIGIMRLRRSARDRRPASRTDLGPPPAGISLQPGTIFVGGGKNRHTIALSAGSSAQAGSYRLVLGAVHLWGGSCGYPPVGANAPFQLTVTP